MSPSRSKHKHSLWAGGSVALADILANSVAVILILIIVTLSVQQDNAQIELEKNASVTTILARQIATSVVYNDLPSSPPALLHDYNDCRIQHDCDSSLFPIIEIHQNYVREFNSNIKIYRNELLRSENLLDQLIKTFSNKERLNVRIDVYDVNLYYLALGVIKEHNINPRHWHYLGENIKPKKSFKEALADGGHGDAGEDNTKNSLGNKLSESHSENSQGNKSSQESNNLSGTELADIETFKELQYDSLLPPNKSENSLKNSNGSDGSNPNQGNNDKESDSLVSPDALLESLVELLGEGDLSNGQQDGTGKSKRSMKFRVPNVKSSNGQKQMLEVKAEDYNKVIITFLLDQLLLARTQRVALSEDTSIMLKKYTLNPEIIEKHPNIALITQLNKTLNFFQEQETETYAPLEFNKTDKQSQLILENNSISNTNTLKVSANNWQWTVDLKNQKKHQISLLMRLYPGLYKGQRLDFPKNHLLIVHPEELKYKDMQWRPVVVVDKWLENPSLGFIMSSIKDNQLIVDPQSNQVMINHLIIPSKPLVENKKNYYNSLLIYGLGTLIILLLFSLSLWVGFRRKNNAQ